MPGRRSYLKVQVVYLILDSAQLEVTTGSTRMRECRVTVAQACPWR
jgi:hypothetical protein